jgi:DNA anti-recombination protein RmuC
MDWTDDRLQERFDSIDRRFDEVYRRFDEVDRRFGEVDRRLDGLEQDLRDTRSEITQRLDGMHKTMVQGVIALTSAFVAGFAALIVLIATQL